MLDAPIYEYSFGNGRHVCPEVIKLIVSPLNNILLYYYTLSNDYVKTMGYKSYLPWT